MLRTLFSFLLALFVFPSIAAALQVDYDVYIIAGQSNADGRGEASDLTSSQLQDLQGDALISFLNPGADRELSTPGSSIDVSTNGFQDLIAGGFSVASTSNRTLTQTFGPELSFAASIGAATGSDNRVAIIKVTRGGTNLRNDWSNEPGDRTVDTVNPESPGFLYRALIDQIGDSLAELQDLAGGGDVNVEGFLWHQGESDSNAVSNYTERFQYLADGVRAEIGEDIPIAVGELSRDRVDGDGEDNSVNFNNNLASLAEEITGVSVVSSLGLTTPDDDLTHFDAAGQLELGRRFAQAFATTTSVPEPSSGLLVLALGMGLAVRRNRNR